MTPRLLQSASDMTPAPPLPLSALRAPEPGTTPQGMPPNPTAMIATSRTAGSRGMTEEGTSLAKGDATEIDHQGGNVPGRRIRSLGARIGAQTGRIALQGGIAGLEIGG